MESAKGLPRLFRWDVTPLRCSSDRMMRTAMVPSLHVLGVRDELEVRHLGQQPLEHRWQDLGREMGRDRDPDGVRHFAPGISDLVRECRHRLLGCLAEMARS